MRRISRHLTYSNVMVTILAFIVLTGGTAVALGGANTVQSDDLGPGSQVKAPDVAANAVNGSDVAFNSLTGDDVNENSLDRVRNAVVANLGGTGRSSPGGSSCNPESIDMVTCAQVTINLPASSRVLLSGQATARTEPAGGNNSSGSCRMAAAPNGAAPGSDVTTAGDDWKVVSTTMVWGPFPAGSQTFRFECRQLNAIRFEQARITAVGLSGS